MRVRFTRVGRIQSGKGDEAMAWAGKIFDYFSETFEVPGAWGPHLGGTVGNVYWYFDYESLAQMEDVGSRMWADDGYKKLLAEGEGLFVDGSFHDQMVVLQ